MSRQRPDAERVDGIGTPPTPDAMGARSTPRWMYVAGIIAIAAMLLFVLST